MELLQPAFSRGEVNPLVSARVDQQFYQSALKTNRNFIVRPEGGVSNRPGTQMCFATKFLTAVKIVDFVYNNQQSYELEFGDHYVRFAIAGVQIQSSPGVPYELVTPYAAADLVLLRWTQSADTLTLAHPNYTPYQIQRLTATTFSISTMPFKNGPFLPTNTDQSSLVYGVYVAPPAGWPPAITGYLTPPTGTGVVQLNSNKSIFKPTHVGALFYMQQQDLSAVPEWEPNKQLAVANASPYGLLRRFGGRTYKCVSAASTIQQYTGTFAPVHTYGVVLDGDANPTPGANFNFGLAWLYLDSGYGVAQILAYTSATRVIAQELVRYPANVIGGPTATEGPWSFTGDNSTLTFGPLTSNTTLDPSKYIVTVAGVMQDPNAYVITSASSGNITFISAPTTGAAIAVSQVAQLGETYYWAFGAWSPDQGYPATVTYYQDRLTLAGAPTNPQAFWMSKSSNYVDFGVSTPSVDSDALTFKLNSRQNNAITDLIPLTDLIAATTAVIWRIYPGFNGGALTPSTIDAKVQNFYGHGTAASVLYADSAIYVTNGGRKIRDLIYQFQFDKYVGDELTVLARHLIPQGVDVVRMAYAPEPFGQLFVLRSDGILLSLTYVREQQVIGWGWFDTQGLFVDVVVVPESGTYAAYVTVQRTLNGVTQQLVEKFMPREYVTPQDAFFVDSGLTYDGRNESTVTAVISGGVSWLSNDTVSVSLSALPPQGGFAASNVTNKDEIWVYDIAGNQARVRIIGYTSATQATGLTLSTVPATLQGIGSATWTSALTQFSGLAYLNGYSVSIYADGSVVSPQMVFGGSISLPTPGGVVHIGLGYTSDLETLSVNVAGQPSVRARTKVLPRMSLIVDTSQGFMVGTDEDNLLPAQLREWEPYNLPTGPYSDIEHVYPSTVLSDDGHVFVRNSDPSPLTILAVLPRVEVGEAA